jgi:hypothetical protein
MIVQSVLTTVVVWRYASALCIGHYIGLWLRYSLHWPLHLYVVMIIQNVFATVLIYRYYNALSRTTALLYDYYITQCISSTFVCGYNTLYFGCCIGWHVVMIVHSALAMV